MANIHKYVQAAWARCQFPGKERYRLAVDLHAYGHGEHRLTLAWDVPNADPERTQHKWKDRFGNIYSRWQEPGELISVYHQAAFPYQDSYPSGYFERLICQIHTELAVHEALETFLVDGARQWYPHQKADIVCPRTGKFLRNDSWRNVLAWAGVKAAMDPHPPGLPSWAKTIVKRRKMILKLRSIRATWKFFRSGIFEKDSFLKKCRFVIICLSHLHNSLFGTYNNCLWHLEDWLREKEMERLVRRLKKRQLEQETKKEAA